MPELPPVTTYTLPLRSGISLLGSKVFFPNMVVACALVRYLMECPQCRQLVKRENMRG